MNFRCNRCGCACVEEVTEGITAYTDVLNVIKLGDGECEFDYGNANFDTEDSDAPWYQCTKCYHKAYFDWRLMDFVSFT